VVRGSWFVVRGRRFLCTYSTTVQKLFENSFRRFRSRSLQRISSKMPRRRTLLRLTAKETAHVNARSLQSFLWVIVNEFMSSIVCTNAEGRLLESTEERRRRNWSLSRTMKWDGRGRLREREYSVPWFCAVKKKWPGKYSTETTRMRKMPRRRTLLRLTAKETAHVNARSLQSFLWVIVNEFMSSIVCTNAEGRLLESTEERRRRNWSLSRTMKWDGRGRLREREYSVPWFCAVKKKWPGKYSTETTRMRVQQCAIPRVKCRERPFTKTWWYSQ